MKSNIKLEVLLILLILTPLAYLAVVWNSIPDIVPVHFNIKGESNGYGSKTELIIFVTFINPLIYLLMKFIPKIDPKGKVDTTNRQYGMLRIVLALMMSGISCFIIYSALHDDGSPNDLLYIFIGSFFILIGNYIQTVKPNYFVGIRTPWALEDENNWRYTQRLGGKAFFISGVITIVVSLLLPMEIAGKVFIASVLTAAVASFVFSYLFYLKHKNEAT